jgi:hypothetical protein
MKFPARLISQDGRNVHIIWENDPIRIGDTIIDVEAFQNGYEDSVRICEDSDDVEYCNSSGGYKKLICGPDKIGYFVFPGTVHHDRVVGYLEEHTVEELHPDTIPEILKSGGECEIQILKPSGWYEFYDQPVPKIPHLMYGKVLISKKK